MPATATALLHIIGIILMVKEGGNYTGVAPRISGPLQPAQQKVSTPKPARTALQNAGTGVTATPLPTTITGTGIESHTAALVFSDSDRRGALPAGAVPFGVPIDDLRYLPLDGVQIRILSAPPPPPAGPTKTTAVHKAVIDSEVPDLQLSHLRNWCKTATRILPQYQYPYVAAAAVMFLAGLGTPVTCSSTAPEAASSPFGPRLDTQLEIRNQGVITIEITKAGHTTQLQLDGWAHFYFANIPTWFFGPNRITLLSDSHSSPMPHYEAYFRMVDHSGDCSWDPGDIGSNPGGTINSCYDEQLRRPGSKPPPTDRFNAIVAFVAAECANSQWP